MSIPLDKTCPRFLDRPDRFVPCEGQHMHMPHAEFMRLLDFNGFQQCHVCGEKGYLQVDHSHRYPNLIRGLLCWQCNREVGRFEHGHYVRGPLWQKIKDYLDNPPALRLGIIRHYREYYEGQNEEGQKTA